MGENPDAADNRWLRDPEHRLHVSDRLLAQREEPRLEGLKLLHRQPVHLPSRLKDHPDRERLAQRFGEFRAAA